MLILYWRIALSARQRNSKIDPVLRGHDSGRTRGPAVLLLGPVEIGLVACIRAEMSGKEQEPGARELEVVSVVEGGGWATSDATVAVLGLP